MQEEAILAKKRDRVIASFLSFKERECDPYLPSDISTTLRKRFLDDVNDLCELAFDLISSENPVVWNEEFMTRFDILFEKISEM
jgi:hypothetical protein